MEKKIAGNGKPGPDKGPGNEVPNSNPGNTNPISPSETGTELSDQEKQAFFDGITQEYQNTRDLTQLWWIVSFYKSSSPVIPNSFVNHHGQRSIAFPRQWTKFLRNQSSWIDLKGVDLKKTLEVIHKKYQKKDSKEDENPTRTMIDTVLQYLIKRYKQERKESIENGERIDPIQFSSAYSKEQQQVLETLYQAMGTNRNKFVEPIEFIEEKEFIDKKASRTKQSVEQRQLNQKAIKQFAFILKTIFSWLDRLNLLSIKDLFHWNLLHDTVYRIYHKWYLPSEEEIVDIIQFLMEKISVENLHETPWYKKKTREEVKKVANSKEANRSIVVNLLYVLFYGLEKYDFLTVKKLVESNIEKNVENNIENKETFTDRMNKKLNTLLSTDATFTTLRLKDAFSIWLKMLNKKKDTIQDLVWWRTYINASHYQTIEERVAVMKKIIPTIIDQIDETLIEKPCKVEIDSIEIINMYKFLRWEEKNSINEDFKEALEEYAKEKGIAIKFIDKVKDQDNTTQKTPFIAQSNKEYIKKWVTSQELTESIITKTSDQKTAWNHGNFQDLKIKIDYTIVNEETQERITNTWWIEWQVAFSDHENETFESTHFYYDRVKQLRSFSRELSNIWLDQMRNLYKWTAWKMINKMVQRHRAMKTNDYSRVSEPKCYIQEQFVKQNQVTFPEVNNWNPVELHTLAPLKNDKLRNQVTVSMFTKHLTMLLETWEMKEFFYKSDILRLKKSWNHDFDTDTIWVYRKKPTDFRKILESDESDRHKFRFIFEAKNTIPQGNVPTHTYVGYPWTDDNKEQETVLVPTALVAKILANQNMLSHKDVETMTLKEIEAILTQE